MKAIKLNKVFNPRDFEDRLYQFWLENKLFAPDESTEKEPYVIVIPPPNVTGMLHMGHGLNNCLQDILIRYRRMTGRPTLWLPGSDHAGIATQNVVERKLRERGIKKEDIGREQFIKETWKVKDEHHAIIIKQLHKIGCSCDWDRERFTLDEGLSKAVREVFVSLFEKGLIYKGNYLVNWCSSCGTAISDDEVEHEKISGKMYHYSYPLAGSSQSIEIATTRPETMLGDTAVAVHPDDPRYRELIGKSAILPLTDRQLPIIADTYVDMEFGSGIVKVTPAHDPNDYEIGIRHNIGRINILNPDGTLNSNVPEKYQGLTVLQARREVIKDLTDQGFFIKEEEHNHQVGHCYRCHTVIEPYLSDQWFVKMRPLADKALETWQQGNVNFIPRKWENTYAHWQKNIRDWCISRQLWWGHRIPVWHCNSCGKMTVSRENPDCCSACSSQDIRQDNDVLDTWFSSALWPFSTLGWPEKTKDLEMFYPTSTLITGYDIIFFWVARMIMMGMEFMKETPFRDVYIHGLIRDKKGRKMSKSLGNGIDPLEVVDEYGADSLKFTISFLTAQGQDILMDKETFKLGSKFANKIWNASRFILMNLEGRQLIDRSDLNCNQVDLWILHQLNEAAAETRNALHNYRFNEAAQVVYGFFWNDFCDWYIEAVKLSLYGEDEREKNRVVTMLLLVLEESLRLLHPFLPFITEEIYQKLPEELGKITNMNFSIVKATYPQERTEQKNPEAVAEFSLLQELVRAVRTLRSEFTIPLEKDIKVEVKAEKGHSTIKVFSREQQLISLLINSQNLHISEEEPDRRGSIPVVGRGFEAFVYIKDIIDIGKELIRLQKEQAKVASQIDRSDKKLANPTFLDKAPPEVIANEKSKLEELTRRREKIAGYIKDLA